MSNSFEDHGASSTQRRLISMAFKIAGSVLLAFGLYSAFLGVTFLRLGQGAKELDKAGETGIATEVYQVVDPGASFVKGGWGLVVLGLLISLLAIGLFRRSRMVAKIVAVLTGLMLAVQVGNHQQSTTSMIVGILLIGGFSYLGWSHNPHPDTSREGGGFEALKKPLFALAAGLITLWSFLVPDAPGFASPEFARIFFWHFPCPIMLTGLIFAAVYFAFRYLQGSASADRIIWDIRTVAALELGLVYALMTMLSGILFSKVQWGAWWSNDPRQTSFLLAMLFYAAYFAVRAAFADPEKRAANSAAYLFATLLPQLFLIFVYPRLPQITSLHPSSTIMKGQLHGGYLYVILAMLTVVGILTVWLYRLRVRAGLLLLREPDGTLEVSRRLAGSRVVARPVSVPPEGGADR